MVRVSHVGGKQLGWYFVVVDVVAGSEKMNLTNIGDGKRRFVGG